MKKLISILILLNFGLLCNSQESELFAEDTVILDFYEVEPQFPGGPSEMTLYIQNNIHYPEIDKKNKEQGTVYVQFVVNLDGSICNVVILKGVSETLDAEAVRVIKSMPKWTPANDNGKSVRGRYTIPISFRLS